jgi:rod shape-determining protein MreD
MAWLVLLPLSVLLVVLQAAVLPAFALVVARLDLVLLMVVAWALTGRVAQAMALGLVAGLLLDLLSGVPLGISSMALIAAANVATLAQGRLWRAHQFAALGAMLLATVTFYAIVGLVILLIHPGTDPAASMARIILPAALLNTALAIPAVQLAAGLERRLYPPKVTL